MLTKYLLVDEQAVSLTTHVPLTPKSKSPAQNPAPDSSCWGHCHPRDCTTFVLLERTTHYLSFPTGFPSCIPCLCVAPPPSLLLMLEISELFSSFLPFSHAPCLCNHWGLTSLSQKCLRPLFPCLLFNQLHPLSGWDHLSLECTLRRTQQNFLSLQVSAQMSSPFLTKIAFLLPHHSLSSYAAFFSFIVLISI